MRSDRKFPTLIVVFMVAGCQVSDRPCLADDFSVTPDKNLEVFHGGQVLIASDSLTYSPGWDVGKIDVRKNNGMTVVNTFHKDSDLFRYRREVGVSKDRIELTCQFRLLPYKNRPDEIPSITYTFRVPYERLKNTSTKALVGRASRPKVIQGKLGETCRDRQIASGARYIAFEGEDKNFVFDLNPKGLTTNMDYGYAGFLGSWRVEKKGDFIEFSCGRKAYFFGGTLAGKVLIYEGKYDYQKVHSYQKYHEIGGYHIDNSFFFGVQSGPAGWLNGGMSSYDGNSGFGWENAAGIAVTRNAGKGLIHNAVYGKGSHVFVSHVTPGIYAVSFRVGGVEAGPFNIALNDEVLAEGFVVKAGQAKNIHLRKYIRSDKLRITFSSKKRWAVSSIIVQPIIYAYEDFAFDRGPWLIEKIFTPEG